MNTGEGIRREIFSAFFFSKIRFVAVWYMNFSIHFFLTCAYFRVRTSCRSPWRARTSTSTTKENIFVLIQPRTSPPRICKNKMLIDAGPVGEATDDQRAAWAEVGDTRRATQTWLVGLAPSQLLMSSLLRAGRRRTANFRGLVLGCIEAKFCK